MYLHRHLEKVLKKAEKQTKVILLTGARQVGKTTSIQATFPKYPYITLDDENELALAQNDRALFFQNRVFPMIIDEVQYEKELLRTVKQIVDRETGKGRIFITGSQTYELMSAASESLAGRVSILEMTGLSMRELTGVHFDEPFIPSASYLKRREKDLRPYRNLWGRIHRGTLPELLKRGRDREWFYRDYIRTYIERDVRRIVNIQNESAFRALLVSLAARSGQMIIYDDIAKDIGVDIKTVQRWVSVIEGGGLIKILPPYHNNAIKRAIKTPKLYFLDCGLLCYLVGWKTAETAKNGAMNGQILETFVISEIMKSFLNAGKSLDGLYYYRDKEKREIDLLIEDGRTLYPVEIKKAATIKPDWSKSFDVLKNIRDRKVAPSVVLCQTEKILPVSQTSLAVPLHYV